MSKWDEKLIQFGTLDMDGVEEELAHLAAKQVVGSQQGNRAQALWGAAARKLGIDREKARDSKLAPNSVAGVAEKLSVDLAKIRRLGTAAQWATLQEEKKKQDKATEEEAAKNAKVTALSFTRGEGVFDM